MPKVDFEGNVIGEAKRDEDGELVPAANVRYSNSTKGPTFNLQELSDELGSFSRGPFVEVLAHVLQCVPDAKSIEAFAKKHPDRWASTVQTMARLAGFHDKLEVSGNITVELKTMSDADLFRKLDETEAALVQLKERDDGSFAIDDN